MHCAVWDLPNEPKKCHWEPTLQYKVLSNHPSSPFLLKILDNTLIQASVRLGPEIGQVEGCEV